MKVQNRSFVIMLLYSCLFLTDAFAQQVQRNEAIAAYIYNFAKNFQWQHEDEIKDFNINLIGEDPQILSELKKLAKTKTLRNKPIVISSSSIVKDVNKAQIIFITKEAEKNLIEVFDRIEGKNILLVTDGFGDKSLIMINFIDAEKGSLRFEINKANILNQHFRVPADLILLGGTEIDVAQLYREGQQSLRDLQKQAENLKSNLTLLEEKILIQTEKMNNQAKVIKKQQDVVREKIQLAKEHENQIDSLDIKIHEQQSVLNNQTAQLSARVKELNSQIQKIKTQKKILDDQAVKLEMQKEELNQGNIELLKQKDKIISQEKILKEKGTTIQKQKYYLYLFGIILLLTGALFFTVYRGYKDKKILTKELEQKVKERTVELSDSNELLKKELAERRQIENELIEYRDKLEEMVKERTEELVIARDKAEIADQLKSAFLATMSHELRTPLNSIIGFTGILLREIAGKLNEEQKKQLSMVKGSATHLLDLINDVLDISKIEAGELVVCFEPFDFKKSVQKVFNQIQPLADKKELQLELDMPYETLKVVSDQRRCEQILINLLNNSVKFTDRGSVRLECRVSNDAVITKVIDKGIGIKKEHIEKLFKPFSQVDTGLTRNHEGTGLGLSICKRLTEKLGGTISVESEFGTGSTFTFTLPLVSGG